MQSPFKPLLPTQKCDRRCSRTLLNILYLRESSTEGQKIIMINESAVDFLRELGRRISSKFQEERQTAFLFQRLSVTVPRYNAVILHDSFPPGSDLWPSME